MVSKRKQILASIPYISHMCLSLTHLAGVQPKIFVFAAQKKEEGGIIVLLLEALLSPACLVKKLPTAELTTAGTKVVGTMSLYHVGLLYSSISTQSYGICFSSRASQTCNVGNAYHVTAGKMVQSV